MKNNNKDAENQVTVVNQPNLNHPLHCFMNIFLWTVFEVFFMIMLTGLFSTAVGKKPDSHDATLLLALIVLTGMKYFYAVGAVCRNIYFIHLTMNNRMTAEFNGNCFLFAAVYGIITMIIPAGIMIISLSTPGVFGTVFNTNLSDTVRARNQG